MCAFTTGSVFTNKENECEPESYAPESLQFQRLEQIAIDSAVTAIIDPTSPSRRPKSELAP
jgi:hypothetical protein